MKTFSQVVLSRTVAIRYSVTIAWGKSHPHQFMVWESFAFFCKLGWQENPFVVTTKKQLNESKHESNKQTNIDAREVSRHKTLTNFFTHSSWTPLRTKVITLTWKVGTLPKKSANFCASIVADVTMSFISLRRDMTCEKKKNKFFRQVNFTVFKYEMLSLLLLLLLSIPFFYHHTKIWNSVEIQR